MKKKHASKAIWWLCWMIALPGAAFAGEPTAAKAKTTAESQKATSLFHAIRTDADQIRAAAQRLDQLTANSSARWVDYDRQWNEIKPAVEDLRFKVARLEATKASISPEQQKEVDQSRQMIQKIRGQTHQLRTLLDQPGVQTTDQRFKACAKSLNQDAADLEKIAKVI